MCPGVAVTIDTNGVDNNRNRLLPPMSSTDIPTTESNIPIETVATVSTTRELPTYQQLAVQASEFGGKVYGGYVRDHVVQETDSRPNDMDVWLRKQEDLDAFKDVLVARHGAVVFAKQDCGGGLYPFQRQRVNIIDPLDDDKYINLDLILSEVFPVNDFDANLLTWDGTTVSIEQPDPIKYNELDLGEPPVFELDAVVSSIKNGVLTPFPTYVIKGDLRAGSSYRTRKLRMDRFAERGWAFASGPLSFDASGPPSFDAIQRRLSELQNSIAELQTHLRRKRKAEDVEGIGAKKSKTEEQGQ
jgi:hypothetical protein